MLHRYCAIKLVYEGMNHATLRFGRILSKIRWCSGQRNAGSNGSPPSSIPALFGFQYD